MNQLAKSVALFMTEGSSDKEYRVQLAEKGDGWVVNFQNGRRGKPLRHGTKTETPIDYAEALKTYDKLVASKKKGGYTEQEDGRTFQDAPDGKEHSGVRVQLLDEVDFEDEAKIRALLRDPDWVLQQKYDGERRPLVKRGDTVIGAQREGWIVPLAQPVADALAALECASAVLDGEDMGDRVVLFDLLEKDGDLRSAPFSSRNEALSVLLKRLGQSNPEHTKALRLCPTAHTEEEKLALFLQAKRLGQEGLVFKLRGAPYEAGKCATQVKVKFRNDATCQVIERHATKRSVSIGVLHPDSKVGASPLLTPIGNVTLPPSVQVQPGDLIDVRYLYAYEGGSLFQPTFKCVRTDKTQPDSADSLKYKAQDILLELGLDDVITSDEDAPQARERVGMRG